MRTFRIPVNLDLNRRGSHEGHNHNIYQMSQKFMDNVILSAQLLDSMTLFARKQFPNAVIGVRYLNAMI